MTIIKGKKNQVITNKNYSEKCSIYTTSTLNITKTIPIKWKKWNFDTIEARQKELWEKAKYIWHPDRV